jgi:rhodanese-related sulfurtransferase
MSIPGARMIKTLELKALLDANKQVVVIDVLDSKTRTTVPGAYWMPGAGDSRFYGAEKSRFAAALEKLVGSDKNRPIVFLCLSSECWESYNGERLSAAATPVRSASAARRQISALR